jgi:hypothetical protein
MAERRAGNQSSSDAVPLEAQGYFFLQLQTHTPILTGVGPPGHGAIYPSPGR